MALRRMEITVDRDMMGRLTGEHPEHVALPRGDLREGDWLTVKEIGTTCEVYGQVDRVQGDKAFMRLGLAIFV